MSYKWRKSHGLIAALVVLVSLVLSGCATLPMSGPVNTIKATGLAPYGDPNLKFDVSGPANDASPEEIVQGFITAMKGLDDNLQTARKFLTQTAASTWRAGDQTIVYSGSPEISKVDDAESYSVKLLTASVVDSDGILSLQPARATQSVQMDVVKVDGQWRISNAPKGIFLEKAVFETLFRAVDLYFFDPSYQTVVPDVRWFTKQSTGSSSGQGSATATSMVKALLNGPAPYLQGAVVSAFPTGTELIKDAVPITDGKAEVELSDKPLVDSSKQAQQRMQLQLLMTLQRGVNTVNKVDLKANKASLSLDNNPLLATTSTLLNPTVDNRQVGVRDQQVVYVENRSVSPVQGISRLEIPNVTALAQSYQRDGGFAVLGSDSTSLYSISPGQAPLQRIQGIKLTNPSISPDGRIWSAASDRSGNVFVAEAGAASTPLTLNVPWLKDQLVTSLRVARDGARVVIVIDNGDGTSRILLAGIARIDNSSSSLPKSLQGPSVLAQALRVTQAYWADQSTVIAFRAGDGDVTPYQVSVTGTQTALTNLTGLRAMSVGDNVGMVFAQTTSGAIFERSNSIWSEARIGAVYALAFPG